jgi:hypothetical protein
MWRVWGTRLVTSDLTDKNVYQTVIWNKNIVFRGVRTWIIHYNDPTYVNLNMKLYTGSTANKATSTPKELLATSLNVITKAEISTLANAHKEIWFEFQDIALNKETIYHLVLNGDGYVSNWPTSGLAWRRSFPDPIYKTNVTSNWNNINRQPYMFTFIASEI